MKSDEMVSLNGEMINCNFDDLSVEQLESRLELAMGALPMDVADCTCDGGCPQLVCCVFT